MDEIKYHFQVAYLLQGLRDQELIDTVESQVKIKEFKSLFQVFLIKEIVNSKEAGYNYDRELHLLKLCEKWN